MLDTAHKVTASQRAKDTPLTAANLGRAVVVVRADPPDYTLLEYPFLVGDPRLNNRVLYAVDRGPASARLAQLFPSRRLYQFVQRTEPGHPLLRPSYIVEPMRILTGPAVQLRFDARNTTKFPVVVAYLQVNGRTVAKQTLARRSSPGAVASFGVVLGADPATLPAEGPRRLVASVARDAQISVGVAFGPDADPAWADTFERRFYVSRGGAGLAVQTPGLQYHRFDFGHVVWVRQNVEANLAEHALSP